MNQDDNMTPKGKCILIVDDETVICEMLAFLLEKHGFTTRQAFDANTALTLAAEHECDLLLTDFYLPKANGLELARRIRDSKGIQPKAILMTGNISAVPLEVLEPLGPFAVIEKPLNFERLLKTVRRMLMLDAPA